MLFEILTGRRAFPSVDVRLREETTPPDPSQIVEGTDPAVARAVRQCLQPDPRDRPNSAAEVFALLAAGDPFKALLGSEDTPAPEMVAAAGARGGLGLRPPAALMGTILAERILTLAVGERTSRLVEELVGEIELAGGYVRIISTRPIIGQMLFGVIGPGGIQLFSAVPPTVIR